MTEKIFQTLELASNDREQTVSLLAEESKVLAEQINQKYPGRLNLRLEFYNSPYIEAYGWILDISQAEDELIEDDPYLPQVAMLEISELEVNDGKVKASFYEWFEGGQKRHDSFGKTISLEPANFVKYLRSVLDAGDARPELLRQENESRNSYNHGL